MLLRFVLCEKCLIHLCIILFLFVVCSLCCNVLFVHYSSFKCFMLIVKATGLQGILTLLVASSCNYVLLL